MLKRDFIKLLMGLPILASLPALANIAPSTALTRKFYLTIDDGWCDPSGMLDVTQAHQIKTTLFLVGQAIEKNTALWRRALTEGHELGCHTQNHHPASKQTLPQFRTDLMDYRDTVQKHLGSKAFQSIRFFRFPYGDEGAHRSHEFRKIIMGEFGWEIARWNMDLSFLHDPFHPFATSQQRIDEMVNHAQHDHTILLHFTHGDMAALGPLIEHGLDMGFRFGPLSEKTPGNIKPDDLKPELAHGTELCHAPSANNSAKL